MARSGLETSRTFPVFPRCASVDLRQAQPRFQQKVNITATQPLSAWWSTTTTRSCYDVQAVAQKHCRRPPPMNSVITSTNPHMCRVAVRLRLRARIPSFNRSKDSRLFFVGADDNRALITQSACRETSAFVFFFSSPLSRFRLAPSFTSARPTANSIRWTAEPGM